jgi:acetyltransferase-like isoleucine patch superfamily enzyme
MIAELRAAAARERARRRLMQGAPGVRIERSVHVRSPERLVIGEHTFIDSGAMLHCGGMEWSPDDGGITLGANVYIGPNSVLFGAAGIEIGDGALISPGVVITSHQHTFEDPEQDIRLQPLRFARVLIERNVWVGANATILPGVRLGEGSVVGAGAVAAKDVPAGAVVLGVPARVSRER